MNKATLTLAAVVTVLSAALCAELGHLLMTNNTLTDSEFLTLTAVVALCAGGVLGGSALVLAELLTPSRRSR